MTKIKRKKAISLQPDLAVTVSQTDAVALSEHTVVTDPTCRTADSKAAADIIAFSNMKTKDRMLDPVFLFRQGG